MGLLGKEWVYYKQSLYGFWQGEPRVNVMRSPGQDKRGAKTWSARRTSLQRSWPCFKAISSLPQFSVLLCNGGQRECISRWRSVLKSTTFSLSKSKTGNLLFILNIIMVLAAQITTYYRKVLNRLTAFSVTLACQKVLILLRGTGSCWLIFADGLLYPHRSKPLRRKK